jgi:hypothetical protein
MTELGEEQNQAPTASNEKDALPHIPNFPEELQNAALEDFKDGTNKIVKGSDWLAEHFRSENPDFPGDIILLYNIKDEESPSYEIQIKRINNQNLEERIFVKVDHRLDNPRVVIGKKQIPIQSLDQNPNDQQL